MNVFEGKTDDRQGDTSTITSRFRPRYRALDVNEKSLHDEIKVAAVRLEELFEQVHPVRADAGHDNRPRENAIAMTKLEEAVMWAVKGLTA